MESNRMLLLCKFFLTGCICILITPYNSINGEELEFPVCDDIFPIDSNDNRALCYALRMKKMCRDHCEGMGVSIDQKPQVPYYSKKAVQRKPTQQILEKPKQQQIQVKKPSSSAKETRPCDGIKPCVSIKTANAQFTKCCKDRGVNEACMDLCNYKVTGNELKNALMTSCEVSMLKNYLACAANDGDQTNCCQATGILSGEHAICKPFCNPGGGGLPQGLGDAIDFLPCLNIQSKIMKCHWAALKN